jgi:hypothetical protein
MLVLNVKSKNKTVQGDMHHKREGEIPPTPEIVLPMLFSDVNYKYSCI